MSAADRIPDDVDPDWYLDHVVLDGIRLLPGQEWRRAWQARAASRPPAWPEVHQLAIRQGFVLTHRQVLELGCPDRQIRSRVRCRLWSRPRPGIIAPLPPGEDESIRAAITATAAVLARSDHAIAGRSAAVLHGLPVVRLPDVPELNVRKSTTTGQRRGALVRAAALPACDVADWFGAPVTSVARTVVDLGRQSVAAGLIAADAALHERRIAATQLGAVAERCAGWPGIRSSREAIALADPRSESPLESLIRLLVIRAGLPCPRLQVEVTGRGWRYRVDLLWPEQRTIVEADGRVKYSDDALWREKRRQEHLERAGFRVVRVLWSDVAHEPERTAARIRWALNHPLPR